MTQRLGMLKAVLLAAAVVGCGWGLQADPGVWCEPVDGNTIWTAGGARVFHTHTDSPASLSLVLKNDAAQRADPIVRIELDLPKGISVAQAFTLIPEMYRNHLQRLSHPLTISASQAGELTRYSLAGFKPQGGNVNMQDAVILCFEQTNATNAESSVLWRTVRKSGAVTAGEPFTVKVLPPMPASPKPKRMGQTGLFYTFDFQFPDAAAFERGLKKYDAANIGGRWAVRGRPEQEFSPAWFDRKLAARGWPVYPQIGAESPIDWQPDVSFPLPPGARRAQTLDGQLMIINGFWPLCPHFARTDATYRTAYREWIKGYTEDASADYAGEPVKEAMIDIEPFKNASQACFCDDCIRDFAKSCKLDAGSLLTNKASILTQHRNEWSLYQSRIETEAIAWIGELLHEFLPAAKLAYYCHPIDWDNTDPVKRLSEGSATRLDPRIMERVMDIHAASFYNLENAKAVELFESFQTRLTKEQRPFLSLARAIGPEGWYTTREGTLSPEGLRVKMNALAASGARGFYLFPGGSIDGLYFDAMRRAQADLAQAEEFYLDGKKAKVSGSASHLRNAADYVLVRGHQLKGETLVTLVNFNANESAFVKLDWPGAPESFAVADLSEHTLLADGETGWQRADFARDFLVEVPAQGVKLLVLNPAETRVAGWKHASVKSVREKYAATVGNQAAALEKMRHEIGQIIDNYERGGLTISAVGASLHQLRLAAEDNLVVMESPRQKIWISPADGGKIVKWQHKPSGIQILPSSDVGKYQPGNEKAAWDCFWIPEEWRYYFDAQDWKYRLQEALINEQGVAMVKLAFLNQNRNLYLEKTFRLRAGDDALEVAVNIRNLGENPQAFNFWARQNPKLGFEPQTNRVLMPMAAGLVDARTKDVKTAGWNCIALTDPEVARAQLNLFRPGVMTEADVLGKATAGKMVARRADGQGSLTAEMELDQVLALWRTPAGGETWSLEWIYRRAELQPLETWQTSYRLTFGGQ